LTIGFGACVRGNIGISWSVNFASTMSGAMIHMAVPRSDTSMTDGSPVRSRRKSAAAMPPAVVMPPAESPNAARCMVGRSASGGVSACAMPPRDQNEAAS
jgi:hypothetical protein